MAITNTIGTNTWRLRLSDNADDTAGVYAWYFDGLVAETWDNGLLGTYASGGDESGATTIDIFNWTTTVRNIIIKTKAQFDLVKRAFRYWNANDTDLYWQEKIATVDNGYWANDTYAAADEKIRCKIIKIVWNQLTTDQYVGTMMLLRVTDV